MKRQIGAAFLAAFGLFGTCFVGTGLFGTQAHAADFPTTVREILDNRADGPLTQMDAATRSEMTTCVIQTLEGLPKARKSYILEGATLDERQDRFGKVVYANRAEWQKRIAGACADIATRG